MMSEDQKLIGQIKGLSQIKPEKDWVFLTKNSILGEEPKSLFLSYFKPAFAGVVAFAIIGTLGYGFVKNSLPGDVLYVLRKTAHEGYAFFVSNDEKSAYQLKLANDRLEDLTKAPIKNVGPTIDEFQINMLEAARTLENMNISTSSPETIRKIVQEARRLEENKQKVESLGVFIGNQETSEFDNIFKGIVSSLIKDLEERTLDERKETLLDEMKGLFEDGEYSEALELYLINQ
ncbi:MAG: hypothetical protein ABH831_01795 [Candidatus Nealsonbacteria bacterium]